MRDIVYDMACEDLARHFLGERADQKTVAALAAHIQVTIEDWIGWHLAPQIAPDSTETER